MKRLLLAGAVAGVALVLPAPANATIWACDNAPASVQCFSHTYGDWCTVWVQATRTCFRTVNDLLGPIS